VGATEWDACILGTDTWRAAGGKRSLSGVIRGRRWGSEGDGRGIGDPVVSEGRYYVCHAYE
jgi:hypothetical protein